MTLAMGTKLGSYEIRSQIGEGGMGEVYRARDNQLGRGDGQRFLVNSPAAEVSQTPITIVLNWTANLKR